jgi:transposase
MKAIPTGKTITLIVDNYISIKASKPEMVETESEVQGYYQPVYSPWVNHVERLWQALLTR